MCHVFSLPPEVMIRSLKYLRLEELGNLRLSCKAFRDLLNDTHVAAMLVVKKFGPGRLVLCNALMYLMNSGNNNNNSNTATNKLLTNTTTAAVVSVAAANNNSTPSTLSAAGLFVPGYQPPPSISLLNGSSSSTSAVAASSNHNFISVPFSAASENTLNHQLQQQHQQLSIAEIRKRARFAFGTKVLTPTVASLLLRKGAVLPRYICQLAVRDVGNLPPAIFAWIISMGYTLYSEQVDFHADDHVSATKIVMDAVLSHWIGGGEGNSNNNNNNGTSAASSSSSSSSSSELQHLRVMIMNYGYIPLLHHNKRPSNLSYFLFKLANMDISLIDCMRQNGLDIESVNDDVLKWALRRQAGDTLRTLREFLAHGFRLTPAVMSHGLQLSRPDILETLRNLASTQDLQQHAESAIMDILGPHRIYTTDGILDHIRRSFVIPDSLVSEALLRVPADAVYRTRPYPQQHPATAWRWTLRQFGPFHACTAAAFDDILRKLASGPSSHCCLRNLPEVFVTAGVQFLPSQSLYLAHMCRSEEMHGLAEQIFGFVKTQLDGVEYEERREWIEAMISLAGGVCNSSSSSSSSSSSCGGSGTGNSDNNNLSSPMLDKMIDELECANTRRSKRIRLTKSTV